MLRGRVLPIGTSFNDRLIDADACMAAAVRFQQDDVIVVAVMNGLRHEIMLGSILQTREVFRRPQLITRKQRPRDTAKCVEYEATGKDLI
jgi:hypothetical protein